MTPDSPAASGPLFRAPPTAAAARPTGSGKAALPAGGTGRTPRMAIKNVSGSPSDPLALIKQTDRASLEHAWARPRTPPPRRPAFSSLRRGNSPGAEAQGTSRHGAPVRTRRPLPLMDCRFGPPAGRPRPAVSGSNGSSTCHCPSAGSPRTL
ncbi:hypothetical protein GCM10010517_70390 [Streptosporangium fragile]|uniref:Uncharacterized protein n=1 Tax=Streptosporangium fragile TaxID=46186 RepID=A0ABN3W8S7_9ACTN